MDFSGMKIKLDHSVGSPEAVTNWRQSVGFPVFGTGQVILAWPLIGHIFIMLASHWSRQITLPLASDWSGSDSTGL